MAGHQQLWSSLLLGLVALVVTVEPLPEITSFDKVATLNENTLVATGLSTISCSSNPPGDVTRVYLRSVEPGSPCQNCFATLDCGSDKCLQFRPGSGRLNHDITNLYKITVSCEDSARNSVLEVIQVVIIPNQPPKFKPDTLHDSIEVNAKTDPGEVIGKVKAEDDDGDRLSYTLDVVPASAYFAFSIQSNGEVVANVDLRTLCRSFVTLQVTVNDGYNTVGPKIVAVSFKNNLVTPIATNLNTEIQIPEDTTGRIYTYLFVPDDDLTYTVTTSTAESFAQFSTKEQNLDVAATLDYEQENLRVTEIFVQATNGYCESDTYRLEITVTDVNEVPVISDHKTSIEVCEGRVEFAPPFTMTDQDEEDTHQWTIFGGNSDGLVYVHPETGMLGTNIDYDVDPDYDKPKRYSGKFQYKLMVTDKGGLTATATVTASFLDCNDNAPRFSKAFYTYKANECTAPGSVLGRLQAEDADSKREGNNDITFSGASGAVDIGETGSVILTKPLAAGTVVVFDAYAHDQGLTPGPLRSEQPAKVSVIFGVCPPASDSSGGSSGSGDSETAASNSKVNLSWIVVAALLGAVLLGLLSFMLWRYWDVIGQACKSVNCNKACRSRPDRPRPERVNHNRQPASKPPQPQPPKREPPPPGPSFLTGFWKERFSDDDYRQQPDRRGMPSPADMNYHDTNTYDPVEPPHNPPPPEPKKKFCTIL